MGDEIEWDAGGREFEGSECGGEKNDENDGEEEAEKMVCDGGCNEKGDGDECEREQRDNDDKGFQ